jgi:hypothetical protein
MMCRHGINDRFVRSHSPGFDTIPLNQISPISCIRFPGSKNIFFSIHQLIKKRAARKQPFQTTIIKK